MDERKAIAALDVLSASIKKHGVLNVNATEVGRVARLALKAGWSIQRVATRLALDPRRVRRSIDLAKAPVSVRRLVLAGHLSVHAGLALAKLDAKTRGKIKKSLYTGITAKEISKLARSTTTKAGVVASTSNSSRLKGLERDASLVVRPGLRAQNVARAEAAYCYLNADNAADRKRFRDKLEVLLWEHGDIDSWRVSGPKRVFDKLAKAAAARYRPDGD